MKTLKVHKFEQYKGCTNYYFTKSKNKFLMIEYEQRWDFGEHSSSGVTINKVEINYYNSVKKDRLTEITMDEVPKAVKDILTYLAP